MTNSELKVKWINDGLLEVGNLHVCEKADGSFAVQKPSGGIHKAGMTFENAYFLAIRLQNGGKW